MSIFQKIANAIKGFKTPAWLKTILKEIQDIIVASVLSIGKEYLKAIENKILEVADSNMTSEQKFEAVFTFAKKTMPDIKDATLNLIIEVLVSILKKNSFVRIS